MIGPGGLLLATPHVHVYGVPVLVLLVGLPKKKLNLDISFYSLDLPIEQHWRCS
jgi:hypothetical protein